MAEYTRMYEDIKDQLGRPLDDREVQFIKWLYERSVIETNKNKKPVEK